MSVPRSLLLTLLALGLTAPGARAQKLDKESKSWLEEVTTLILPDEEKTFRSLKDKGDREEFQKIFWARRDPDLDTPQNEYQVEFEKTRAEADRRFKVPGRAGSATDCGRVFILLGEADDVKKDLSAERTGFRPPETWTYRDRPGQSFVGGQAQIAFDSDCQFPPGSRAAEQLQRVAEGKIAYPNLGYRFGKDGRLVKLEDLRPKPSPAQVLLKSPRQDFSVSTRVGFLKTQDGGTVLLGLVRGDATGLAVQEEGGKKKAKVVICAQAVGEDGRVAAFAEQETTAEIGSDNSFVAAYRMALKPGKYNLWGGAVDPKTQKGALASVPVEVPDLNKSELTMGSVFLVSGIEEGVVNDPAHPFAPFAFGPNRLIPKFGEVVSVSESLYFFYQFYDAKVDEATGKRSAVATLNVLKDGKPIASAADDTFDGPVGANLIGPMNVSKWGPGKYTVRLTVKDTVAQKEYVREVAFETVP